MRDSLVWARTERKGTPCYYTLQKKAKMWGLCNLLSIVLCVIVVVYVLESDIKRTNSNLTAVLNSVLDLFVLGEL
jgi:hypothetical protein